MICWHAALIYFIFLRHLESLVGKEDRNLRNQGPRREFAMWSGEEGRGLMDIGHLLPSGLQEPSSMQANPFNTDNQTFSRKPQTVDSFCALKLLALTSSFEMPSSSSSSFFMQDSKTLDLLQQHPTNAFCSIKPECSAPKQHWTLIAHSVWIYAGAFLWHWIRNKTVKRKLLWTGAKWNTALLFFTLRNQEEDC